MQVSLRKGSRNSVGSSEYVANGSRRNTFQPTYGTAHDEDEENGCCAALLTIFSYILVFLTFPISIWGCIKVGGNINWFFSLIIFLSGCARIRESSDIPPWKTEVWRRQGSWFILCCSLHWHLQACLLLPHYSLTSLSRCVDLRTGAFDVPPQEILTRDSVTVSVDAVVYYQVPNIKEHLPIFKLI